MVFGFLFLECSWSLASFLDCSWSLASFLECLVFGFFFWSVCGLWLFVCSVCSLWLLLFLECSQSFASDQLGVTWICVSRVKTDLGSAFFFLYSVSKGQKNIMTRPLNSHVPSATRLRTFCFREYENNQFWKEDKRVFVCQSVGSQDLKCTEEESLL